MSTRINAVNNATCKPAAFTLSGFIVFWFLFFSGFGKAEAQIRVQHISPQLIEQGNPLPLTFDFQGEGAQRITEAVLFTRESDESAYTRQEVVVSNLQAVFNLLIESGGSGELEYYIAWNSPEGQELMYPDISSDSPPLRLSIRDSAGEAMPPAGFVDVSLLTPEEGRVIPREEFIFAAALFYDEEDVEGGLFFIELNGRDITSEAEITPFLIKYIPDDPLLRGDQQIRIIFEKEGVKHLVAQYSFKTAGNVVPVVRGASSIATAPSDMGAVPRGSLELSARNQEISGFTNDALDARLKLSGQLDKLSYSFAGFLTTLESPRLQPQNRYSGNIQYGDWLRIEAGDIFPNLSELSASGRKVRGISSDLRFFNEKMQFQFLYGQMRRGITSLYDPVQFSEQYMDDQVVDTLYTMGFSDGGRGAFKQDVVGGRIAMGNAEKFQISLYGLKVQDDTTSVSRVRNFQDVMNLNPGLTEGLPDDARQALQAEPNRLQVSNSGLSPQGNTVLGSEFSMAFDSQRIQLHTELAASMFNRDITGGPLTMQRADELGIDLNADAELLFSNLSWLMIINENMRNLPFRYSDNDTGGYDITPFFPTSILANKSYLRLNYGGHNFQVQYQWIGPDYQSLANRTLLRDVAGFTISDRFRAFRNRLFVNIGYENLRDNLAGVRDATLNTETARSSISWFPVREFLPNVTFTFRHRTRNNNVQRFNPYMDDEFLNSSVRNFILADGDVVMSSTPRDNRTLTWSGTISQDFDLFNVRHQANASFTHVNTADYIFDYGDSNNNSFSLQLMSRFEGKPFRTRTGWNSSFIKSIGSLNHMEINAFNVGGDVFLAQNKLAVNADFSIARNNYENIPLIIEDNNSDNFFDNRFVPSSEESESRSTNAYTFRMGATYDIMAGHTLAAYVNYTSMQNRYIAADIYPDDRILQLRYIFRF
ncbi:MAG: hypothetical protein WEA56_03590 [Balneolaceae bacterium]